ncbi:hypothetical protein [Acidithrix sp. C25]|uniref:hypothetical protein n=1 Tax=Acidithrix sp. C25 TaxID=1671482 RepID=UPI00191BAA9B|nr:hypothetical protein [Acidithrix sp. C25]
MGIKRITGRIAVGLGALAVLSSAATFVSAPLAASASQLSSIPLPKPNLLIGGGGTTYFSGPATYGPNNLHLCTETNYDLARFGPVSFCASDVPLVKLLVEAGGACLFAGFGVIALGSSEIQTAGVQFAVGCASETGAWGWIMAIGSLASPAHTARP